MGIAISGVSRRRRKTPLQYYWNRTGRACSINWSDLFEANWRRICFLSFPGPTWTQHPYLRFGPGIPCRPSNWLRHQQVTTLHYHPPLLPLSVSTPSLLLWGPVFSQLARPGRAPNGSIHEEGLVKLPRMWRKDPWLADEVEKEGKVEECGERVFFLAFYFYLLTIQ